jgi:hypothetical protein
MKKPRDSQRSKLYGWERSELKTEWLVTDKENTPLGEAGCQKLVNEAWAEFAYLGKPPTVRVMGNRGRGTAGFSYIKLSASYLSTQTKWYVLHELAHVIITRITAYPKKQVAGHGPEFCTQYARLLDKHTAARFADVIASMKDARLKTLTQSEGTALITLNETKS